ncbi:MAG: HAD-IA family hydrolase [Treponema sp.]
MIFIFDMGGVVTTSAAVEKQICDIIGISEGNFFEYCGCGNGNASYGDPGVKLNKFVSNSSDLLTLLSNGTITTKQFWQEFSARSGKSIQTDYWHLLFHPELNEDVAKIIRILRRNYRVVCGTNTIESHYMNHIERGDYTLFDQTYASNVLGVSKPDPEFWKLILLAEGVKASDVFFTDDNINNCTAASSLGLKVHQFINAADLESAVSQWL